MSRFHEPTGERAVLAILIGSHIKSLCVKTGVSAYALAAALRADGHKLHINSICLIMRGKRFPSYKAISLIYSYFDLRFPEDVVRMAPVPDCITGERVLSKVAAVKEAKKKARSAK